MYPFTESEAKVTYEEPLFVIDDYFFMTVFIRGARVEDNISSECVGTVVATYGCNTQFYRIKGGGGLGGAPPPPPHTHTHTPITFEPLILPQQTIYLWKGNLTANRIHFKYLKNILISRFYEQFSQNGSAMAPERLFEKFQTFKI